MAASVQVIAVVFWFSVTKFTYFSDCENSDNFEFCSSVGPGLVAAGTVVLIVAAVLFVVVYSKRGKSVNIKYHFRQVVPSISHQSRSLY